MVAHHDNHKEHSFSDKLSLKFTTHFVSNSRHTLFDIHSKRSLIFKALIAFSPQAFFHILVILPTCLCHKDYFGCSCFAYDEKRVKGCFV